uniref:Predicted protein n=1 Tax=Hordeum vulgare subsp. vulgare TaxID=112509 RepID=F2DPD8_HORVV|nr:predicted protein [Hordeum vulgare subsp. vulgare]
MEVISNQKIVLIDFVVAGVTIDTVARLQFQNSIKVRVQREYQQQKKTTTQKPYSSSSTSTFYYIIGAFCTMLLFCFLLIICRDKPKRRGVQTTPYNNNNVTRLGYPGTQPTNRFNYNGNATYPTNNNSQSNTRSAFVVADNSAYNYDINKIYNSNFNDDLPPSYDTIKVQQKNTEETNETNV